MTAASWSQRSALLATKFDAHLHSDECLPKCGIEKPSMQVSGELGDYDQEKEPSFDANEK